MQKDLKLRGGRTPTLERDIEKYLVREVEARGGEIRKVRWDGRSGAPDRRAMLPGRCAWVEVKNPETIKHFPTNAHERAQYREHERMRKAGEVVLVLGTREQVDEWLRS